MSLARAVHQALSAAGIVHAVGGAVALAVHGAPRSTQDLDFLTVDPAAMRSEVWSDLSRSAVVEIRRGDLDDPLLGVVRVQSANETEVDVVIARGGWIRSLLAAARPARVGDDELPIVGVDALVLLKLDAGGPKDLWDIHQLLDARDDRADIVARVDAQVRELPPALGQLWLRVLADRG